MYKRCMIVGLLTALAAASAQQPVSPAKFEDPASGAEQVARSAGLLPLVARLKETIAKPGKENAWHALYLRQQILERVTGVSLQVDGTIARIESEVAQANEFRNELTEKRDRRVDHLNLAGIGAGGALGVVSSALQISAKHAKTGNSVGIGAGVIVTVISVMALRAQNGKPQAFQFRSNMLAKLFDRPADETDVYSPAVLAFLDAIPAVDPDRLTRKQRLVRTWEQVGRLTNAGTSKDKTKIDHLTGAYSDTYKLTISELYDRRAMLEDLRAKLALLKRDLAAFLLTLPESTPDF